MKLKKQNPFANRFLESQHLKQEINLLGLQALITNVLLCGYISATLAFIMEHAIFKYSEWINRPKYPYLP